MSFEQPHRVEVDRHQSATPHQRGEVRGELEVVPKGGVLVVGRAVGEGEVVAGENVIVPLARPLLLCARVGVALLDLVSHPEDPIDPSPQLLHLLAVLGDAEGPEDIFGEAEGEAVVLGAAQGDEGRGQPEDDEEILAVGEAILGVALHFEDEAAVLPRVEVLLGLQVGKAKAHEVGGEISQVLLPAKPRLLGVRDPLEPRELPRGELLFGRFCWLGFPAAL